MPILLNAWNRLAGAAASVLAIVSQFVLPLPIDRLDSPIGRFPTYVGFLLAAVLALIQWPMGVWNTRKHLLVWGFLVLGCIGLSLGGWTAYSGAYDECTGSFQARDVLVGTETRSELVEKGVPKHMTRLDRTNYLQRASGDTYLLFTQPSIDQCRGKTEGAYCLAVFASCFLILSAAQFFWILNRAR